MATVEEFKRSTKRFLQAVQCDEMLGPETEDTHSTGFKTGGNI